MGHANPLNRAELRLEPVGVPVNVVSERLGHANATITLAVYQNMRPGTGREVADRLAALLEG